MTDCVDVFILQAKDHDVLKVMEKALRENKTSEKLTLINAMTLLKVFCRHALLA